MSILIIFLTIAIFSAVYIYVSLPIFNLLQLEGYKYVASKKIDKISINLVAICMIACVINYIILAISDIFALPLLQLIAPILLMTILLGRAIGKSNSCARQPLVYTNRAKRLLVCFAVLVIVFTTLTTIAGSFIAIRSVKCYFVFNVFILPLLPVLARLSLEIMLPIERKINQHFVSICKKRLDDMPSLVKIGITGSYGKTSVKLILTTILSTKFKVFCTPSNYNTPMGICLSVSQMPKDTEIFVAEMGARNVGDIKELCDIVRPKYGIITGIGNQHLESFKSVDNIIKTKSELIEALPTDGFGVFDCTSDGGKKAYELCSKDKIGIGISEDICAKNIEYRNTGCHFSLCVYGKESRCECKLIGRHNLTNILLAVAMAYNFGMSCEEIALGIEKIEPIKNRLEVSKVAGGITIIDDSYNANEAGARLALDTLEMFVGRKIVASQGLVELGEGEKKANFELGEYMARKVNLAILIGVNAEDIASGLEHGGFDKRNIFITENLEGGQKLFSQILKSGDILLLQNDLPDNYLAR